MTYDVSSGTLNSTIPYTILYHADIFIKYVMCCWMCCNCVMAADCRLTNTDAYHMCVCVFCFEDSFVNSQEWTLSRAVPDLKLVSVSLLCTLCMCECGR